MTAHRSLDDVLLSRPFLDFTWDAGTAAFSAKGLACKYRIDERLVQAAKDAWDVLGEPEVSEASQLLRTDAVRRAQNLLKSPRIKAAEGVLIQLAHRLDRPGTPA